MDKEKSTLISNDVTHGSDNVFADLGFTDAAQLIVKARLAKAIHDAIQQLGLSQAEAAQRVGLDQPKISKIVRGQLQEFSTERLMNLLLCLGFNLEIRLERVVGDPTTAGAISVAHP
jgi:predicted XRE-type DNA-binding protein